MRLRAVRAGLLVSLIGMAIYCALHLRIETNVLHFMPRDSDSERARVSARLADSDLTRTMALSIGGDDPASARATALELAERLAERPEVAWVRTGVDTESLRSLYELYFPRRHAFLSEDPEREIPELLSEDGLRSRARALKRDLALPASTLLEELAGADPIGAFRRIVERFRGSQSAIRMEGGQFVSRDGRFAIVLLATRQSAFDSASQGPLLDFVRSSFQALSESRGGGLVLEMSGANRFAVESERRIKRDIYWIGACSTVGLALIFMSLVGGLQRFILVAVPSASGILVATTLGLLVFGTLDGLTMAFGAAMMGVAIDYSIHLMIHHGLSPPSETPERTARRLRGTLTLGAATTMASFVGLALTAFPAFREMSFFAIVGLGAALAMTLVALPGLLGLFGRARRVPPRAARLASLLGRGVIGLRARPRALAALPVALVLLAPLVLPRLQFVDDLSQLGDLDPALFEEDRRVRERISRFDASRFVIATAPDVEAAVALNDEIHRRLEGVVRDGGLDGMRSLHALLWSQELQRRNLSALAEQADADLGARLQTAFAEEGFRPDAFAEFALYLESAPQPLTLAELEASGLGDLLSPWIFALGDRTAVAIYLRGVHSVEAIESAIADLPGVYLFDNRTFINDVYGEFRRTTLRQMLVGGGLVLLLLLLRYRRWRPSVAAFLPAALVAIALLEVFSITGVEVNLLHVMSLIMVLGMGVDYGIFVVDSADEPDRLGATMLSLLVSCATTVFVFGTLAISFHPALRAIGLTVGLGILLALLFAPVSLLLVKTRASV
ncbi:MAG: MMPL family transporter [Proteobacteria bacterium]|nr:MMPL family transporter [Pseudomonadota bacterium]